MRSYKLYLDRINRILRILFASGEGPSGRRPQYPNNPVNPVQFLLNNKNPFLFTSNPDFRIGMLMLRYHLKLQWNGCDLMISCLDPREISAKEISQGRQDLLDSLDFFASGERAFGRRPLDLYHPVDPVLTFLI